MTASMVACVDRNDRRDRKDEVTGRTEGTEGTEGKLKHANPHLLTEHSPFPCHCCVVCCVAEPCAWLEDHAGAADDCRDARCERGARAAAHAAYRRPGPDPPEDRRYR